MKPYYNVARWRSGLGHHHTEIIVVRRPWVRFLTDPQLAIKRGENSEQADKLAKIGYKCCGRWWKAKFCFELHSHSNLMKEKYVFAQIKIHVRWTVISSSIVHHPLLFYAVYRFRSRYKIKKFLFKKIFFVKSIKIEVRWIQSELELQASKYTMN